jgi:hypothetical protein
MVELMTDPIDRMRFNKPTLRKMKKQAEIQLALCDQFLPVRDDQGPYSVSRKAEIARQKQLGI